MCDCLERLENRCKEDFINNTKDFEEIKDCSFDNKAFIVEKNKLKLRLTAPVTIQYTRRTKKGNIQNKSKKTGAIFSYCPFCGEEIESEG